MSNDSPVINLSLFQELVDCIPKNQQGILTLTPNSYLQFSFGLVPASALKVNPIAAGGSATASLPLRTTGTVQKMNPINNLQVSTFSS